MKLFKILSLLLFLSFFTNCKKESTESTIVNNNDPIEIEFIKEGELSLINNDSIIKKVDIELAKTNNKRAIGLMNRSQMDENRGMLFIFEEDNNSGFYMKDTRIPLDIIFLGEDKTVITVTKNRQPYDLNSQGATAPYRYVLEVNGGMAQKWGVKEGTTKIDWIEL